MHLAVMEERLRSVSRTWQGGSINPSKVRLWCAAPMFDSWDWKRLDWLKKRQELQNMNRWDMGGKWGLFRWETLVDVCAVWTKQCGQTENSESESRHRFTYRRFERDFWNLAAWWPNPASVMMHIAKMVTWGTRRVQWEIHSRCRSWWNAENDWSLWENEEGTESLTEPVWCPM